jgi:Chitin binding Peritrophin-A domain
MECEVDPDMTITATTNAKWYGAPGPLKCGPKSLYPTTGYWDFSYECNQPWSDPPSLCTDYAGQKAGKEVTDEVVANANGRMDIEGCCWWGRGAIQTSGVCNYGRLNYYFGKRAHDEGRNSRYPTLDFCKTPDAICSSEELPELKWIAGMFYWIDSVQAYEADGWNYITELHNFVDGGLQDDAFIHAVSGIVNRGCHNPPCASGDIDGGPERVQNFQKVLAALQTSPSSPVEATSPEVAPVFSGATSAPVVAPVASSGVPWMGVMCCDAGQNSFKAIPGCRSFYLCVDGEPFLNSLTECPSGLVFDISVSACNWEADCQVVDCPTEAPTEAVADDGNVVVDDWAIAEEIESGEIEEDKLSNHQQQRPDSEAKLAGTNALNRVIPWTIALAVMIVGLLV